MSAWRATSDAALERRVAALEASGRGEGWTEGAAGHGRTYRFSDPDGHPMSIYFESEYFEPAGDEVPTLKNQPQRMSTRGAAVRRLDHVNVWCRDIDVNSAYMVDTLGFRISEQVIGDDGRLVGSWLHVTPKSYDLAYGRVDPAGVGGRLHHVAFAVDAREYVMRAADVFLDAGVRIECGPAKHAVQQTCFLYAFEPGGNRIEVITDGRLLLAPDWPTGHVDDGGAQARPGMGDVDARELVHLRDASGRGHGMTHDSHEEETHGTEEPAGGPRRDRPGRAPAQLPARRVHLPGRAGRVHELAARAERVARDRGPLRPVAPHGQPLLLGPDALKLLSDTGDQQLRELPVNTAKQFVPTATHGGVIGDGILFHEDENEFVYVGRAPAANWLQFHAETGGYDVEVALRRPLAVAPVRQPVHARVLPVPDPGPERVADHREAQRRPAREGAVLPHGRDERRRAAGPHAAPRHGGRARTRALGPVRDHGKIRDAILEAGKEFGLEPVGLARVLVQHAGVRVDPLAAARRSTRARSCARTASGSRPSSYEAINALAGSFVSDDIEDYYLNPWELGYGSFVKFDHDFIGREALEKVDPDAQRKKVTLAWNDDDLAKILTSVFDREGAGYQVFDLPNANYGSSNYDAVIDADGNRRRPVAVHRLQREREAGALAGDRRPGEPDRHRARVVWGEPDGGSRKTTVQPHEQMEVRAVVSPVPYSDVVRASYAEGWRTKEAVR